MCSPILQVALDHIESFEAVSKQLPRRIEAKQLRVQSGATASSDALIKYIRLHGSPQRWALTHHFGETNPAEKPSGVSGGHRRA